MSGTKLSLFMTTSSMPCSRYTWLLLHKQEDASVNLHILQSLPRVSANRQGLIQGIPHATAHCEVLRHDREQLEMNTV